MRREDHESTACCRAGTPDDDSSLPTVSSLSDIVLPIDQDELSSELQAAFRWAVVGFQSRNAQSSGQGDLFGNAMDADPFETDAFKKASFGLIQATVRLLGSEDAFLSLLEVIAHSAPESMLAAAGALRTKPRSRTAAAVVRHCVVPVAESGSESTWWSSVVTELVHSPLSAGTDARGADHGAHAKEGRG